MVWETREDLRAGKISLGKEEPESDNFFLGVIGKASKDTEGQESEDHSHLARSQKSRLHYGVCCENHYLLQRDHSGQMSYEELEKLPDDCRSWWMLSWLNCLLSVLSFQDRVKQMKFIKYALCGQSNLEFMDRVNMSIAILPMSQEFNWNNATVGLILSSFFWGLSTHSDSWRHMGR